MIENDTWYKCNICGREGRVGRCCSDEERTPLNALAKAEQERKEETMDICFWEEVDTGDHYESGCNKKGFQFNDGSPYDNGFKFCPYCGKQLKIKKPIFDEPDI